MNKLFLGTTKNAKVRETIHLNIDKLKIHFPSFSVISRLS